MPHEVKPFLILDEFFIFYLSHQAELFFYWILNYLNAAHLVTFQPNDGAWRMRGSLRPRVHPCIEPKSLMPFEMETLPEELYWLCKMNLRPSACWFMSAGSGLFRYKLFNGLIFSFSSDSSEQNEPWFPHSAPIVRRGGHCTFILWVLDTYKQLIPVIVITESC